MAKRYMVNTNVDGRKRSENWYVWNPIFWKTEGKKIRFQTKTDSCERDLVNNWNYIFQELTLESECVQ